PSRVKRRWSSRAKSLSCELWHKKTEGGMAVPKRKAMIVLARLFWASGKSCVFVCPLRAV
ncbi:MAG: hypothetical protein P8176_11615, partial [Gammaproteobacteria bacterium]